MANNAYPMDATVKQRLRAEVLLAREAVGDALHTAEARALSSHLPAAVGTEPGSPELLDALLQLCSRVLLPVTKTFANGTPLPLRWGEYRPGRLVPAQFGLLEPPEPWLPPTELATAGVLLVPALSVDRHGVRLGRGAGFYDRSLGFRDPSARVVAVVRDDELVDALPVEPHDIAMTHALTPRAGLVALSDGS
jgi:5-formyltetrahydrofolate cyclo-ligase